MHHQWGVYWIWSFNIAVSVNEGTLSVFHIKCFRMFHCFSDWNIAVGALYGFVIRCIISYLHDYIFTYNLTKMRERKFGEDWNNMKEQIGTVQPHFHKNKRMNITWLQFNWNERMTLYKNKLVQCSQSRFN